MTVSAPISTAGRFGIDHRNPALHPTEVDPLPHRLLVRGQIGQGAHLRALGDIGTRIADRQASAMRLLDDVRQVEFGLGIRRPQLAQRREQELGTCAIESDVDLADGALLGVGVLVFDDAGDAAAFTDDPPESCGRIDLGREQGNGGAAALVRAHQAAKARGREKRQVAVDQQDIANEIAQRRRGHAYRVSGSTLFLLAGEESRVGSAGSTHRLLLVADDDDDRIGTDAAQSIERVGDQWPAGEFVEDLRTRGAHARAEAGGEDDGSDRAARFHPTILR